jgi:uncharacterized protein (DUF1684 family)
MKTIAPLLVAAALALPGFAADRAPEPDPAYRKSVEDWRARVEQSLRRDNGWLTLAGRYVLKPGENTFGTGPRNDVIFPAGLGPVHMGVIEVQPGKVVVKMVEGLVLKKDGQEYAVREMGTSTEERDWVAAGPRATFHVIEHMGRYVLRLADNQSPVRAGFGGRVWYEVDDRYRVKAKYVPYDPPRKIAIVNVLDEVSDEPAPGYVEFEIDGRKHRLDAVGEDDGLFFVFKDATAGDTTYAPTRFLHVDERPMPGASFLLDFNRAYNPPCAFSEYTTCPLPPKQNVLKVRIDAGEKYPPRKLG